MKKALMISMLGIYFLSGSTDLYTAPHTNESTDAKIELSKTFAMSKKFLVPWSLGILQIIGSTGWFMTACYHLEDGNNLPALAYVGIGSASVLAGSIITGKCLQIMLKAAVESRS